MYENTLTVKDVRYAIGILPADKQFHLARRIGPILASMGISIEMLKNGAAALTPDMLMTSLGPVSQVLAHMDDETVDYVLGHSLSVVKREQVFDSKTNWVAVTTPAAPTTPLFSDIGMPEMLRLVVEVLMVNLLGFTLERAAPKP